MFDRETGSIHLDRGELDGYELRSRTYRMVRRLQVTRMLQFPIFRTLRILNVLVHRRVRPVLLLSM